MFYLVTEGVLSRGLQLCAHRFISKQSGFTVINWSKGASFLFSQRLKHNVNTQLNDVGRLASSARFFSGDRSYSIDLEDEGNLLSLPPSVVHQTAPEQNGRISSFFSELKQCGTPSEVLDLTCKYDPPPRQLSNCLTHMWSTIKKMPQQQRHSELQLMFEHPAFYRLLQSLMKTVQCLTTLDIAYSLLSMVNLGFPQRSRVVQTFLRHCQVGSRIKVELNMFFQLCSFECNVFALF